MKRYIISFSLFLCLYFLLASPLTFAQSSSSSNYMLIDPEIVSNGGETESTNYKTDTQIGSSIIGDQLSSSLYKVGLGHGYVFMAHVPKIKCFETTTNNTSACSNLPHAKGMIQECGEAGCYDRAKLEIDAQNNPSDTVYSIEISPDNWATTYVVDGTTHLLKQASLKTISDYLTKTSWETGAYASSNIYGLDSGKTYSARVRALHGNYTESPAGPSATATTALPTVVFDIDTGPTISSSTNAPYSIAFATIAAESPVIATDKIWITLSTNSVVGSLVMVRDSNDGLRTPSKSYTLSSSSEDLALITSGDGFGLKTGIIQNDTTAVGFLRADPRFNTTNPYQVGGITSSGSLTVFCGVASTTDNCSAGTGSPVLNGRGEIKLIARASLNAPAVDDYTDTLNFTVLSVW